MSSSSDSRLRVAAISFLNPAPLMWDFDHAPRQEELARRYALHSTLPSQCAEELLAGRADLGLIPIASLTPELAIVPGCTIASLNRVRSIQLLVRKDLSLSKVKTVAADTASRSSLAYVQVLFRWFMGVRPTFLPSEADPVAMLQRADAALLIGDPALLALEDREQIEAAVGPCDWYDVAHEWIVRTGLPWVAAVWAVRPEALPAHGFTPQVLIEDLLHSRDAGLKNTDALVQEWTPRIPVPPATIQHYLTENIHYLLTPECLEAIRLLRRYAAETEVLPPLPRLRFLE